MDVKGKRFLVIGGAGLIGSHTVEQLLKDEVEEIRIFDNFSRGRRTNLESALKDKRVNVFPLGGELMHRDLLNEAMQGIDGVFHFAALWLLHCHDFPRSAFEVNIAGTFNVLEAMLNNGVRRMVYSSSASVYGDAVQEPMTEDHPYNNLNFYGATKIAGEHMCRSLHHRYKGTDKYFDYVGLRYMNVYGPRQDYNGAYIAVIMKMLDAIDRGESPTIFGDGSEAFDFISVHDCARANVCAMKSDATDRFYNVGTGQRTSLKELASMLIEMTGCRQPIRYVSSSQATLVRNRVGCPLMARREIAFEASISLEQGLRELVHWRQSHIIGGGI
ncbi:NAD-dependent epimerase/dehydratase family protein [Mariprofundus erugo]|uniref:NAD-dependent epimerase/dehydratase family protein n=1 Tax=Mariprofundus erugo TaxID=2528639 RepID=UPI0010FE0C17|nr:NAD-dependent epimerase/dehydratase family protein [Mariprofundus erugo]TLS76046.1 NAD-dependent epimerase/dehydratase family protein [Mariprofundus erugo]